MIPAYLSPLANHLWQSTMVVGAAALLALALRNNGACIRYWVWFTAAVKFLIPFSLLIAIGHQFEWRTPPPAAQRPISTVAEITIPFVAQPPMPVMASRVSRIDPIPFVLLLIWFCGFTVSLWLWIR